ncbi:MAG: hypothetical protein ACMUIP_04585 [bacterium]
MKRITRERLYFHIAAFLYFLLLFIAIPQISEAAVIEKTYGGSEHDEGIALEETSDHGYSIGGTTQSFGAGDQDFYLIKIDACGNSEWEKQYGISRNDKCNDVLHTADGGYALLGYTTQGIFQRYGYYVVKTDEYGEIQWENKYGWRDYSVPKSFKQTADGGFIILGCTTETDPWLDFRLSKVDAEGNEEWVKFFGRCDDDTGMDIEIVPDDGYILVGRSGYWSQNPQAWIIKTDSLGNKEWSVAWGGSAFDEAYGVCLTRDGGYAVVGATKSYGAGDRDAFLLKLDSTGQEKWHKVFGEAGYDEAKKVYQRPNGNFVLVGTKTVEGNSQAWLIETNEEGDEFESHTFGVGDVNGAYDLASRAQGFALVGRTRSGNEGNDVYFVTSERCNNPPVALCKDVTITADENCQGDADINNGSYDPDPVDTLVTTQLPSGPYEIGETLVRLTVADSHGETDSCSAIVTVEDNTPPAIYQVIAEPNRLWPPNHKFVEVTVSVNADDNCDVAPVAKILDVTSNEPLNSEGDGNTQPDWEITGDMSVKLRAESSGTGDDRVYTIIIAVGDESGNASRAEVTVVVPHDESTE